MSRKQFILFLALAFYSLVGLKGILEGAKRSVHEASPGNTYGGGAYGR